MDTLFLIIAGFVGGFIGAQSGGGAIITLPALLFLGVETGTAIATNILSGWLINVAAVIHYQKHRMVQVRTMLPFGVIAFIGALAGSCIVLRVDEVLLRNIVAGLFLFLLVMITIRPKGKPQSLRNPTFATHFLGFFLSFVIGAYGGFFLVGVATLFAFLFILLYSQGFLQAIANAVFISSFALIASVGVFAVSGAIYYPYALPLAAASIAGAFLGARTAVTLGERWVGILTGVVVLAIIARLIFAA